MVRTARFLGGDESAYLPDSDLPRGACCTTGGKSKSRNTTGPSRRGARVKKLTVNIPIELALIFKAEAQANGETQAAYVTRLLEPEFERLREKHADR